MVTDRSRRIDSAGQVYGWAQRPDDLARNAACLPLALRHQLPAGVARALMRVRFDRGWTCGRPRLRRLLADAGFEVLELSAVLHFPRIALEVADRVLPAGHAERERALRLAIATEWLERTSTRFLTGHYVDVLATAGRPG